MWKKGHRQSYYGTHKLSNTKIYKVYYSMKQRCFNPKCSNYKNYGGRGITVCDEWRDNFLSFYNWAIHHGYMDGLVIDRVNNNGNYEPSNCRWITEKDNSRNKRTNRILELNGERHSVIEWSEIIGIPAMTIYHRLFDGWDSIRALTTPLCKEKIHLKELQEQKK